MVNHINYLIIYGKPMLKEATKMDYCSDCDIAYEGRICPLCDALHTIEELEKEVKRLNDLE